VKQVDLFFDSEPVAGVVKADPLEVLRELAAPCRECRLGQTTDKQNNGIVYEGSPHARIALVGDMPEVEGTMLSKRLPIAAESRRELSRWLDAVGIPEEDVVIINTVQCKTTKGRSKNDERRLPFPEEVDACFPNRTLRVLQAMPNLEVVLTMGWTSAGALLGRNPEPGPKSHEGQWFGTDYLPGVAVICFDHPREYGRDCEARKKGKLLQFLQFFQTEYLRPDTAKIMPILKRREAERARAKAE
jgi:uracil-DNA glycosylase family 4